MSMLASKKVIGIKTESAQNTLATLAATDFFNAFDVDVTVEGEELPRDYVSSSLDPYPDIVGKGWMEAKFKRYLHYSGIAGTALAPMSALLQAFGFGETVTAPNVTYAPSSNPATGFFGPGKSATVITYEDGSASANGLSKVIKGCIGDAKIVIEAGKLVTIESTLKGIYTAVADATVPTNTPSTTAPAVVQTASFSVGGYSAIIQKLEIDLGNAVGEKTDVNSARGIGGYVITDRKPKGSMDPEATVVATNDWYGKFIGGTTGALSIVIGATAGNICTITMPTVQFGKPAAGKRSGDIMTFAIPLKFFRNTGDDWISIVFT